jgi:hypothetical protein
MAMTIKDITNIEAKHLNLTRPNTFCLSCEYKGDRYHVWLDIDTLEYKSPFYKNPPLGSNAYRTRELDPDGATGRYILGHIMPHARDLYEAERERLEDEAEKERQERLLRQEQEAREKRLQEAAPDLLSLLEAAVARVKLANADGNPILSAWLIDAEAAITKATHG